MYQYSDIDLRKYDYLLEHFYTNIFIYRDNSMKVHIYLPTLDNDQVDQMSTIDEKLISELNELVKRENLFSDFQKKLV